tara:strand:- start:1509 stop:1799 length:291 start_codon:yes stop_codon:yes gene_type:complete
MVLRLLVGKNSKLVRLRALVELHRLVLADFCAWSRELRYFVENQKSISENGKWDKNVKILSTTAPKLTSWEAKATNWHQLLLRGQGEPRGLASADF